MQKLGWVGNLVNIVYANAICGQNVVVRQSWGQKW